MTHAYSESYLDDAMQNLGDMLDYALVDCGYTPDEFFSWFISSGIAAKIENGNPKYITGMSGVELAREVVFLTTGSYPTKERVIKDFAGREYWAGWILAYYQWYSSLKFSDMVENGLSLSGVLSLYILHEADQSKFVETANEIISRHKLEKPSNLTTIRKARGFTQGQLAQQSGVALRMIQLYEQRQNDISKAQAGTLLSLAKALGCDMEDLIEADLYLEQGKEVLAMSDINLIWNRIVEFQGQTFYTVKKIPYTYHVSGNQICLENTNRKIPKDDVEKALAVANPSVIRFQQMNLQGPSYLLGIITDLRILNK